MTLTEKHLCNLTLILGRIHQICNNEVSPQIDIDILGKLELDFSEFISNWWNTTYMLITTDLDLWDARIVTRQAVLALQSSEYHDARYYTIRAIESIQSYINRTKLKNVQVTIEVS